MFDRSKGCCPWRIALGVALAALMIFGSSCTKARRWDIQSAEDSVILGRIRFLPGVNCDGSFKLPTFELCNITEGSSTPFATLGDLKIRPGQSIEIPISRKVNPGDYALRMKSVEAPPQSRWLKPKFITLSQFSVAARQLIYFGTVEVNIRCERWQKQSATHYLGHTITNEYEAEIRAFRDEYPQAYEIFEDHIVLKLE